MGASWWPPIAKQLADLKHVWLLEGGNGNDLGLVHAAAPAELLYDVHKRRPMKSIDKN